MKRKFKQSESQQSHLIMTDIETPDHALGLAQKGGTLYIIKLTFVIRLDSQQ